MVLRILTRLGVLLASLAVASVVVFGFMAVLPGSPARVALGVGATDEAVAAMEKQYGLDQSLPTQYVEWASGLVRFDLGESYVSGAPIGPQVLDRFQVTLWLVVCAIVLALLVAVPLGTLMAVRHRNISGMLLSAFSQLGVAIPAFLAALLLVAVFAVGLNWLPSGGWTPPAHDPVLFLKQLVLPVISLALVQAAVLARYVRSAVLDVMREDYIRTARAKGLTPMRALTRHGLRNAAIPVVTVLGLQLATLLIGAVVVERVFAIPGLGSGLLDAVAQRDLILVQDIVMLLVAAVLIINFVVDLLYVLIDPRLRGAA